MFKKILAIGSLFFLLTNCGTDEGSSAKSSPISWQTTCTAPGYWVGFGKDEQKASGKLSINWTHLVETAGLAGVTATLNGNEVIALRGQGKVSGNTYTFVFQNGEAALGQELFNQFGQKVSTKILATMKCRSL